MNKPALGFFARNRQSVRDIKKNVVFRVLFSQDEYSQSDLSKTLRLNKATISHLVNDLKRTGLIEARRKGISTRRGGKRPIILGVKEHSALVVGCYLNAVKIETLVSDLRGREILREERRLTGRENADRICRLLTDAIDGVRTKAREAASDVAFCGAAVIMGGRIDGGTGTVLFSLAARMKDYPLGPNLCRATGIPVFIEDAGVAFALRERFYGHARHEQNYVFLRVLPFLRAIVFIDGKLYPGRHHNAGQVGASIGKMGFGDTEYLCDLYDHEIFGLPAMKMRNAPGGTPAAYDKIGRVFEFTENLSSEVDQRRFERLCLITGQAVVNLIAYYDPPLVVFSGIPENRQPEFLDRVKNEVRRNLYQVNIDDYRFGFEKIGAAHKSESAVGLVVERLFDLQPDN